MADRPVYLAAPGARHRAHPRRRGEIDRQAFTELYQRAGLDDLTFFEQLTVVGLLAFAEEAVDATVLEVGLGGRMDATNVVDAEVAVVTGIASITRRSSGATSPASRVRRPASSSGDGSPSSAMRRRRGGAILVARRRRARPVFAGGACPGRWPCP